RGILADTYEAYVGEKDHRLHRKFHQQQYFSLHSEIKNDIYVYENTDKLNSVYKTYKNMANKYAKDNKLGPLVLKTKKDKTTDIYNVTMQVGFTTFKGINRNHKKANLICYI